MNKTCRPTNSIEQEKLSPAQNETTIINVSAYKFTTIEQDHLPQLKAQLLSQAKSQQLKGTILLSTEGINLFLSGRQTQLQTFLTELQQIPSFNDLPLKFSPSLDQPFTRMLVRIKKEIISMGVDDIQPSQYTAPHLSAEEFKTWYQQDKDMVILDTRNDYEIKLGTFKNAVDLNIKTFRAFPKALDKLPKEYQNKPVITFCTGGIRCEKAAALMLKKGFKEVYQLDGGILKYFENCGGEYYNGECFVFDKRVAVDHELNETSTQQCFACRMPLSTDEQQSTGICPHCKGNALSGKKALNNNSSTTC